MTFSLFLPVSYIILLPVVKQARLIECRLASCFALKCFTKPHDDEDSAVVICW